MKKETLKKAFHHLRNTGKAHTQQDIANKMGVSKTNISRAFNGDDKYLTNNFLLRFNEAYDNLFDYNWLITGEGDMINNNQNISSQLNFGSINGDNKSSYTNTNVGNKVSITLPKEGTQKIIRPDGTYEITSLDPNNNSNLDEIERLRQYIQNLERLLAEKDATIQSKDDAIRSKDELISFLKGDRQ